MKHEITPWSIYDQHANNFGPYNNQQKNRKEIKKLSLLPQQNFYAIKQKGPLKMRIALEQQKIGKGFNAIVILSYIRKQMQVSNRNQLELPEIKHSLRVDLYKMRRLRPNRRNQSKPPIYIKDQRKKQPIERSNSYRSLFNVMNYDPFNHEEIVQRGLIQIMKIRQRIHKSLSKDHHSLNKI